MDPAGAEERKQIPLLCRLSPVHSAGPTFDGNIHPELHWRPVCCRLAEVYESCEFEIGGKDSVRGKDQEGGRKAESEGYLPLPTQ